MYIYMMPIMPGIISVKSGLVIDCLCNFISSSPPTNLLFSLYPSIFFPHSESFVRLWPPGCRCYGGFSTELDHSEATAPVCSHHAHWTEVRGVILSSLCVCVVFFSHYQRSLFYHPAQSDRCHHILAGAETGCRLVAQCYCPCPSLEPHNIKHSPLRLSNLQRHREQAGVQQERGCLLGTTRVCQLSGTRSGSPHSLPQPERKIGRSSHQSTGYSLHPAVLQVQ